jgi:hypothetical protein
MKTLLNRFALLFILVLILGSCAEKDMGDGDAATSTSKDESIREYNIELQKEQTKNRFPCDTISLQEYVLANYEPGTYPVLFDRTYTYNIPKAAVIYFRDSLSNYILGVIAKSKPGERNIEAKNITGYSSSFINLDSTKLGTAFFFLTLFECKDGQFIRLWESEVPIHGGFSRMTIKTWSPKNIKYVELNYQDGIISGHRNFNFFLVDGWRKPPHLLETYVGLVLKRVLAMVNNDKYPDYYEYLFSEGGMRIQVIDSIPFYWNDKRKLYVNDRNPRWFRKY